MADGKVRQRRIEGKEVSRKKRRRIRKQGSETKKDGGNEGATDRKGEEGYGRR